MYTRKVFGGLSKCIILMIILLFPVERTHKHETSAHKFIEVFNVQELDREEFAEFCELGMLERSEGIQVHDDVKAAECSVTAPNEFDMEIDGKMLCTLILIVAWGALIRAVIHNFDLHFPYTVVLMLSGLIIGYFSKKYCVDLHEYTAIARTSAKIILFTFLPLLIFESAFSIPVHTFSRSVLQIILVSFPGIVMCTFFTASVCMRYFAEYNWTFMEASLFGSIISATDPVAVVAILRELGVSEVLSVMIEGESLLNDGAAILLFEIFEEILVEKEPAGFWAMALHITVQFIRIAVGGPVFGYVMGKVTIFLLSYVFNDPPVEISATIVTAYLTYWLSEDVLHVSGVMAVVLLGITMRAERTVISPDSEGPVHNFWEILGYLANTVLFVLVGIVITETALNDIEGYDWWNLILLYVTIHVARFLMLLCLYPILTRIGYGLTWQNMMVMMWGGLRGAVGVSLALEVYRSEHFCNAENKMGAKMLFQTAGIVLLTLVLNGTTTKSLLKALGLTEISIGRKEDMNNALKRIQKVKGQGIRTFQLSSTMFYADWAMVADYCVVKNPYVDRKAKHKKKDPKAYQANDALEAPTPFGENTTFCTNCHTLIPNEPTTEEYYNLTEDARMKVIRGMKVAYTHRNSIGLTSDAALQILMADAELAEDVELMLIHSRNFEKYIHNHGMYPWLRKKIATLEKEGLKCDRPKARWRIPFWWLITQEWFERCMMIIIIINIIPVVWEIADLGCGIKHTIFQSLNAFFTFIFTVEFFAMITGHTAFDYFCDPWNYLDFGVLLVSYADVLVSFLTVCDAASASHVQKLLLPFARLLRLLRISRALRLLKPMLPRFQTRIHRKINEQLFLGYDVARAFVHSSEEVLKFLPQMIEQKRVFKVIKEAMENERIECLKSMAMLQLNHPGIAIAVRTRHACRSVINAMSDTLSETKDAGLLDDTEVDVLTRFLELKIKRLWHSPASVELDIVNNADSSANV